MGSKEKEPCNSQGDEMMIKKIVIGVLGVTVVAAGGAAAAYQGFNANKAEAAPAVVEPIAVQNQAGTGDLQPGGQGYGAANGQQNGQNGQQTQAQQQIAAQDMVGEPWTATGTIVLIDFAGLTLALPEGEVYVELGPQAYWQGQGVELQVGDTVTVDGFAGEQGYHAATVTTASGEQIQVRTTEGQPLWSGGAQNQNGAGNGNGNATGLQDGSQVPQPQAQVDEWITLEGTLIAINRSNFTIQTTAGEQITFQAGQPRFFESQGVTFAAGDEVIVVGFWQGTQFSAGDITKVATGQRVMLRDPNGRPLWAGPGNSNGNGNGGNAGNGNGGNQ